jgi:hypothetical protein
MLGLGEAESRAGPRKGLSATMEGLREARAWLPSNVSADEEGQVGTAC